MLLTVVVVNWSHDSRNLTIFSDVFSDATLNTRHRLPDGRKKRKRKEAKRREEKPELRNRNGRGREEKGREGKKER